MAEFMALAAAIETAQQQMAQQYRDIQADYERAMNEAVLRYQRSIAAMSGGGPAAADDDADAPASGEPQSYEQGADQIFGDIGTTDDG